nr:hypothetical protein [uncultured Sphingobacterium sp.]
MKRLYVLFNLLFLFSITVTVKARISRHRTYPNHLTDTLSGDIRKYITQLAVSEGLDKSSIKIKTDSWGEVTVSDKWGKSVKYSKNHWDGYTKTDNIGLKTSVKQDFSGNIVVKYNDGKEKTVRKNISGDFDIADRSPSTASINTLDNLEIRDSHDNLTIESDTGKRTTIRTDILGGKTIEDNKGSRVSVRKDILGNYEASDNNGNRASIKKDIFGKVIIDDPKGILEPVKLQLIEDLMQE